MSGSLQVLCVWQSVLVWQSASPFVSSSLRLSESCNPCVCVCVVCICVWQSVPVSVCAWQSACVCDVINKPIKCDTSVKYATSQSVCSSMVMSETIWLCLEFLFDGKSMSVATLYEPENGNMCTFSPFSDHHSSSVGVPLNWMTKTKIQIGQQIFQTPAQVYDILPSTTAVFSYAIGSRKLLANEQFFCWCSNNSKFLTNNSDYIRRLFYNGPCCLRQLKKIKKSFESRRNSFFLTWGGDTSCLCACLGARVLLQSDQYPNLSEGADRISGQLRGDKELPLQWRN